MVIAEKRRTEIFPGMRLPAILARANARRVAYQEDRQVRKERDAAVVGFDQNMPVKRGDVRQKITDLRRQWMSESILLPGHEPGKNVRTAIRANHFALFLKGIARDLEARGHLNGQLPILAAIRHVRKTPREELFLGTPREELFLGRQ